MKTLFEIRKKPSFFQQLTQLILSVFKKQPKKTEFHKVRDDRFRAYELLAFMKLNSVTMKVALNTIGMRMSKRSNVDLFEQMSRCLTEARCMSIPFAQKELQHEELIFKLIDKNRKRGFLILKELTDAYFSNDQRSPLEERVYLFTLMRILFEEKVPLFAAGEPSMMLTLREAALFPENRDLFKKLDDALDQQSDLDASVRDILTPVERLLFEMANETGEYPKFLKIMAQRPDPNVPSDNFEYLVAFYLGHMLKSRCSCARSLAAMSKQFQGNIWFSGILKTMSSRASQGDSLGELIGSWECFSRPFYEMVKSGISVGVLTRSLLEFADFVESKHR